MRPLQPSTVAIDLLRQRDIPETHRAADALQFDDGGRCLVCNQLAGGDRHHRCWAPPAHEPPRCECVQSDAPEFPTLEHTSAQGCTLTATSKGNCLELTVPDGWRMVVRELKDAPGRLALVWMERER